MTEKSVFERIEQNQLASRSAVGTGAIDCGFDLELLHFLKTLLQLQFKDASVIGKSLQAYVHMAYAGDGERLLKGKHSRNDGMNSASLLQHTKVNFQDE